MKRIFAALVVALCLSARFADASCYQCHHRSQKARHAFEVATGYRHGRPGWIIDHVIPLACGGDDKPTNMQWQRKDAATAKDEWERKECRSIDGRLEGCCK